MQIKKIKFHWDSNYSFLWNIAEFLIDNNWFNNNGKFKEGDVVRYNWKAKAQIKGAIDYKINKNLLVTKVMYKSESYVEYNIYGGGTGSCDVFWLRKAYWWEL